LTQLRYAGSHQLSQGFWENRKQVFSLKTNKVVSQQTGSQPIGGRDRCPAVGVLWAVTLVVLMAPSAKAGFIADYAVSNWTLSTTGLDGSVTTPDSGMSIVLTGGNDGSGNPGTVDFVINSQGAGLVQFQWSYSSLDSTLPICGPSFDAPCDTGGYLLGGVFTELADDTNQISGITSFTVSPGESFGFSVETADNLGEPGVLTVSDFSAPVSSVPEPGPAPIVLVAIVAVIVVHRRVVQRGLAHIGDCKE
jgi:hypothetical protein